MTKKELSAKLADKVKNEGVSFFSDCSHEPEEIQGVIDEAMYDLANDDDVDADDLQDQLMEQADSNTPVYTSELMEWASSHTGEIDESISELGAPDPFRIDRVVAAAYCMSLERDAQSLLSSLLDAE